MAGDQDARITEALRTAAGRKGRKGAGRGHVRGDEGIPDLRDPPADPLAAKRKGRRQVPSAGAPSQDPGPAAPSPGEAPRHGHGGGEPAHVVRHAPARPEDPDAVPVPRILKADPDAAKHRDLPAPRVKKRPRAGPPARQAARAPESPVRDQRDPLAGTTSGPTPEPDSDRFQKAMQRSGAYRATDHAKSPRRLEQQGKSQEKRRRRFEERYRELMETVARSSDELGYDPLRPVTEIPPVAAEDREVELFPVIPERAFVRIILNEPTNSYEYHVIEPTLDLNEQEILFFLRDTLVRTLDGRMAMTAAQSRDLLLDAVRQAIVDHRILIDEVGARRIEYYLIRDFLGYGAVDVLMRDPMIEDISCDGPAIPVYLFHRRYESIKTNVVFPEDFLLDSFVIRLAQRSGKHISIADPLLDATLPDGSRLQATLSREVTTRGSSFTVRKFREDPLTPPDLIRYGTLSPEMAAYFWFTMEHGHSFILAGGTASGKTTSLNAICQFIPPAKKIVSIEDTREINLLHENWIAGVTRSGFGGEYIGGKPAGSIDMYKLLEAALRQRPEYLLVGEVRGPEALTLFQAMATGHAVYSTMHADSATSAVYRLENEPINVPRMMLQTLDLVVIQGQARIGGRMVRRLRDVMEIVGFDPETKELLTNTVFEWDISQDEHRYLGKSYILERIMEAKGMDEAEVAAEWQRRVEVLEWMLEQGLRHYKDVSRIIASYYRDPDRMTADIRKGRAPVLAPLEVPDGVA